MNKSIDVILCDCFCDSFCSFDMDIVKGEVSACNEYAISGLEVPSRRNLLCRIVTADEIINHVGMPNTFLNGLRVP